MGSDHGCDYKGSRDDVHTGSGEGARWGQIMDATAKGPTTYSLEVERDGVISRMRLQREQGRRTSCRWRRRATESDHRCDGEGSWDDVQAGGGEGEQQGQIKDAKEKGAGTTYKLEVKRESNRVRSQM